MRRLVVSPAQGPLAGRNRPPGDKSVSQRAAILGGLARGKTAIRGFLDSDDAASTLSAMEQLGARVERGGAGRVDIHGGALQAPASPLDLGNSGTGLRLLTGALAGHPDLVGRRIELTGDESLSSRPMDRIIEPLTLMGARITSRDGRCPLVIEPMPLRGSSHTLKMASAQVKSAILLAGMFAQGPTRVIEPGKSRDHTERMLPQFGVAAQRLSNGAAITGPQSLKGAEISVPGDPSSAAFIMAAAALVAGSSVQLDNVGLNPTRSGFFSLLQAMGARVDIQHDASEGGESVGGVHVQAAALRGIEVSQAQVPAAIDEFPLLMALAAVAEGKTVIRGAAELRVKECDRIAVMCTQLARLGVDVQELEDGAIVTGGAVNGGVVESHGDHRIAMSFAVLGLAAAAPVAVENAGWIATSYPGFVDDLRALGADLAWA